MTESAIAIIQKFIFDFCVSLFVFTIYDFFLYLVSTFADCVNMGIIGTCSLQSVLVR